MFLLLVSFIAGVLTILAPCVLPVLPIIIGGTLQNGAKRNPYLITAALAGSIVIFTLLLKFSTAFIDIPQSFWSAVSGGIIIVFGLASLFPLQWQKISLKLGFGRKSDELLAESANVKSHWGDILIGMALGPVFSSCSPTYFLILATVLPASLLLGTIYLVAYALGLALTLLAIALLGQKFISRAKFAANPNGWFRRVLGILFILVGIFILTGADKKVQTYLVERGYGTVGTIEENLIKKLDTPTDEVSDMTDKNFPRYKEITKPAGYVNSEPFTIGQHVGKKIILLDFMTYSCINCIRTFPYLNAWNEKYKDQGLQIIGIHTPEFAFEKKIENVQRELDRLGITFPVVLDNEYGTWRAYANNYWPRKYIINLDGQIVYDHIGEGNYEETEAEIQKWLKTISNQEISSGLTAIQEEKNMAQSPETYLGSARMERYYPARSLKPQTKTFTLENNIPINTFSLGGEWTIENEKMIAGKNAVLKYRFKANKVFLVMSPGKNEFTRNTILLDGIMPGQNGGEDIITQMDDSQELTVNSERLYHLIDLQGNPGEHVLTIEFEPGTEAFAFTFG